MMPRRAAFRFLVVLVLVIGTPVGAVADPDAPLGSASRYQTPTLSEGRHIPLPPVVIPVAPPAPDRRPVWVGAGIVVIAAMLWWNRKRRDELERKP